jgi:hypothetical protein
MTRSLNLILITYLKSLKGTLRGSTHKHAVTSSNCIITESKFKPRSTLDSPCQNFNYTGTVVFGCLVQTPQLQCEAKRPTAVKFHPGLLQFRPKQAHTHHIHHIQHWNFQHTFATIKFRFTLLICFVMSIGMRLGRGAWCPQSSMPWHCELGLLHRIQP